VGLSLLTFEFSVLVGRPRLKRPRPSQAQRVGPCSSRPDSIGRDVPSTKWCEVLPGGEGGDTHRWKAQRHGRALTTSLLSWHFVVGFIGPHLTFPGCLGRRAVIYSIHVWCCCFPNNCSRLNPLFWSDRQAQDIRKRTRFPSPALAVPERPNSSALRISPAHHTQFVRPAAQCVGKPGPSIPSPLSHKPELPSRPTKYLKVL
jgi:hypothetical protein